jgi:lipid-A-disaccharide synthase
LSAEQTVIALLPGSRRSEVAGLMPLLVRAARLVHQSLPGVQFVVPAINADRATEIKAMLAQEAQNQTELPLRVIEDDGQSTVGRLVMSAADVVLMASGTATLEAMLLKRPMVVCYRLHWLTWLIARYLVHIPYVSLPNLLANKLLVPELLQYQATPENMAKETLAWLRSDQRLQAFQQSCQELHLLLKQDASKVAAQAVSELMATIKTDSVS